MNRPIQSIQNISYIELNLRNRKNMPHSLLLYNNAIWQNSRLIRKLYNLFTVTSQHPILNEYSKLELKLRTKTYICIKFFDLILNSKIFYEIAIWSPSNPRFGIKFLHKYWIYIQNFVFIYNIINSRL